MDKDQAISQMIFLPFPHPQYENDTTYTLGPSHPALSLAPSYAVGGAREGTGRGGLAGLSLRQQLYPIRWEPAHNSLLASALELAFPPTIVGLLQHLQHKL